MAVSDPVELFIKDTAGDLVPLRINFSEGVKRLHFLGRTGQYGRYKTQGDHEIRWLLRDILGVPFVGYDDSKLEPPNPTTSKRRMTDLPEDPAEWLASLGDPNRE